MKLPRLMIAILSALLLSLLLPAPTMAKGKKRNNPAPTKKQTSTTPPKTPKQPPTPADQKAADQADADVRKAQSTLDDLTAKLKRQYESTQDFTSAEAELTKARLAYEAEYQLALQSPHSTREYDRLLAAKVEAEAKVNALRDGGPANSSIDSAIRESFAATKALTQMDVDALAADPKIAPLKADLDVASTRDRALRDGFKNFLANDQAWSTAKSSLDDAKARLADALQKISG